MGEENVRVSFLRSRAGKVTAVLLVLAILVTGTLIWNARREKYETAPYGLVTAQENAMNYRYAPSLSGGRILFSWDVQEESLQGHTITYEISTNYGQLQGKSSSEALGKHTVIENGDAIRWTGNEILEMTQDGKSLKKVMRQLDNVYVDVIVRADEQIIGYAVFEISCIDYDMALFECKLLKSVYYPKVDGQFQPISQEYVNRKIRQAK